MLTGAITVASGASITLVASSRPPRPTSSSTHIGRMLREQAERRRGLDFENGDRRAGIDALAMFERAAQFVVADEHAAAGAAEPKAFVDPHQIGRGIDVDAQARGFQDRAQIGDRRALAVGAGDMDDRRQFALGMIEPLQQPMHPLEIEIDALRMQRGQPRDQFAERRSAVWRQARSRVRRGRRHFRSRYDLGRRRRPAAQALARFRAPAIWSAAGTAAPASGADRGDAPPCRPCRGPSDIRRAETLPAISRGWSVRSRARRQSRSARRARRSARRRAWRRRR